MSAVSDMMLTFDAGSLSARAKLFHHTSEIAAGDEDCLASTGTTVASFGGLPCSGA